METQTRIKFWHHKKLILAVCGLTSVWLVMAVNAEDKHRKKKQNDQAPSAVVSETKRSAKGIKTISFPALTKHELKIQEALNTERNVIFRRLPFLRQWNYWRNDMASRFSSYRIPWGKKV